MYITSRIGNNYTSLPKCKSIEKFHHFASEYFNKKYKILTPDPSSENISALIDAVTRTGRYAFLCNDMAYIVDICHYTSLIFNSYNTHKKIETLIFVKQNMEYCNDGGDESDNESIQSMFSGDSYSASVNTISTVIHNEDLEQDLTDDMFEVLAESIHIYGDMNDTYCAHVQHLVDKGNVIFKVTPENMHNMFNSEFDSFYNDSKRNIIMKNNKIDTSNIYIKSPHWKDKTYCTFEQFRQIVQNCDKTLKPLVDAGMVILKYSSDVIEIMNNLDLNNYSEFILDEIHYLRSYKNIKYAGDGSMVMDNVKFKLPEIPEMPLLSFDELIVVLIMSNEQKLIAHFTESYDYIHNIDKIFNDIVNINEDADIEQFKNQLNLSAVSVTILADLFKFYQLLILFHKKTFGELSKDVILAIHGQFTKNDIDIRTVCDIKKIITNFSKLFTISYCDNIPIHMQMIN